MIAEKISKGSNGRIGLLQRLHAIQVEVGEQYLPANFELELAAIQDEQDTSAAALDPASALWWFIGPVAYGLFGKDGHQLADSDLRNTVAVLPPPFVSDASRASEEMAMLGCAVKQRRVRFSRLFAALLYGGYPWYPSYVHACNTLSVFDSEAVVLDIGLPPELTPFDFNRQKERIRTLLSPEIKIPLAGSEFPGLIRPIHSPEAIEIARHAKASRL